MSRLPEPWRSFLKELDALLDAPIDLHCIGGFAVSVHYKRNRPTGDIDVFHVIPSSAMSWLVSSAGRGTALHRKHKVSLQAATVASVPACYEDRVVRVFKNDLAKLHIFVLDPYDLALSKLTRNLDIDIDDVKHLAESQKLDLMVLDGRYREELRPIIIGPPERHDLTMKLWIEAIQEERGNA